MRVGPQAHTLHFRTLIVYAVPMTHADIELHAFLDKVAQHGDGSDELGALLAEPGMALQFLPSSPPNGQNPLGHVSLLARAHAAHKERPCGPDYTLFPHFACHCRALHSS